MRRLTLQGVAPADAARIARASSEHANGASAEETPAQEEEDDGALLTDPLSLAAAAIDGHIDRVQRVMRRAATEHGIVAAWSDIFIPARRLLTDEHHEPFRRPGADPLAVFDAALMLVVRALSDHHHRPPASVVLWAEQARELEAHVLGGALAAGGVTARLARASDDPGAALCHAVDSDDVVALGILGAPREAEPLIGYASERGDIETFVIDAPQLELWLPRVHRVRTLDAAVAEITASVQPGNA